MNDRIKTGLAYLAIFETAVLLASFVFYIISLAVDVLGEPLNTLATIGWLSMHGFIWVLYTIIAVFAAFGAGDTLENSLPEYVVSIIVIWILTPIALMLLVQQRSLFWSILFAIFWSVSFLISYLLARALSNYRKKTTQGRNDKLSQEYEDNWPKWKEEIKKNLHTFNYTSPGSASVPKNAWIHACERFMQEHPEFDFVFQGESLRYRSGPKLQKWLEDWKNLYENKNQLEVEELEVKSASLAKLTAEILQLNIVGEPEILNTEMNMFHVDTRFAFTGTRLPSTLAVFIMFSEPQDNTINANLLAIRRVTGSVDSVAMLVSNNSIISTLIKDFDVIEKMRAQAHDLILVDYETLGSIAVTKDVVDRLRGLFIARVDLITLSPYELTQSTPEQMFFGREPEMRMVTQKIGESSFAIVAGRRIGKTSVLHRLHFSRLPAAGYRSLYQDCSAIPDYESFINTPIRSLQPGVAENTFRCLGDLIQNPPGDLPLVLLLDEADKLVPFDRINSWKIFNTLRSLVSSNAFQVVLSGERGLYDALHDPTSPLYNFTTMITLGFLNHRSVSELVTKPMMQLQIELVDPETFVDRIWDFTAGHPNVVQRLCHRLIIHLNEANDRVERRIDLGDLKIVLQDYQFLREDFLGTYWDSVTSLERLIMLMMVCDKSLRTVSSMRAHLEQQYGLSPTASEMKTALQYLVYLRSILKENENGYEFYVKSLPMVVEKIIPLEDEIEVQIEQYQRRIA